jgi:hypothetical protein
MPHMVIFRDEDGKPGYHQADALEDAVQYVEELRNDRQVSETRVFAMQEVPIEFKSYWRVEVVPAAASSTPASVVPAVDPAPLMAVAVAPAAVSEFESSPFATSEDPQPASSRFGFFGR